MCWGGFSEWHARCNGAVVFDRGEHAVADREHEVMRIAEEIELYLYSHPSAADTLEGITKWWLTRQRYEEATFMVKKALGYLIARGVVTQSTSAGKQHIYSRCKTDKQSTWTE